MQKRGLGLFSLGFGVIVSVLVSWMSDALLFMFMMSAVFIILGISSWIHRFHDINISGKWLFLLFGIMFSCNGYLLYYFVLPLPMTLNMTLEELEVMKQEADFLWIAS